MPRRPAHPSLTRLTPLRIATQILTLQLAFYAIAATLILFTSLSAGKPFSLDLVVNWQSLRGDTVVGWTLGLCWVLSSVFGVLLLLVIVGRSKLVLDFTFTLHFLHLLVTSLYTHSLPRNVLWWGLQAVSAALMFFGGVWACQWRELRPMSFGGQGGGSKTGAAGRVGGDIEGGGGGDGEGEGYEMGARNQGRGRDGGGLYEMVGMR